VKFKKGVMDDHSDNFAIVFAAMGVSRLQKGPYSNCSITVISGRLPARQITAQVDFCICCTVV